MYEKEIIKAVAEESKVSVSEILGKSRTPHIVKARHSAMLILYDKIGMSYNAISKLLMRDHSTIISAINSYRRVLDRDNGEKKRHLLRCNAVDGILGETGSIYYTPREAILDKLKELKDSGFYGKTLVDVVDRIVCDHILKGA